MNIYGLNECPKCGKYPVVHEYSLQSPFEIVIEIYCPHHEHDRLLMKAYGLNIDTFIQHCVNYWNSGKRGAYTYTGHASEIWVKE